MHLILSVSSKVVAWQVKNLKNSGYPYLISQRFTVNNGVTFNIYAGTTIYLADYVI